MQCEFRSTKEFAESLGVKPETARRSLCVAGHYLGIRPVKLPNGRLLWPEADRQRILLGESFHFSGKI